MMFGSNTTVSIYALRNNASTNDFSVQPTYSDVEAYIESQSAEMTAVLGEQNNLDTFDMFIEPLTIRAGDKVIDASNKEYRVMGVERHENNDDTDNVYRVTLRAEHA